MSINYRNVNLFRGRSSLVKKRGRGLSKPILYNRPSNPAYTYDPHYIHSSYAGYNYDAKLLTERLKSTIEILMDYIYYDNQILINLMSERTDELITQGICGKLYGNDGNLRNSELGDFIFGQNDTMLAQLRTVKEQMFFNAKDFDIKGLEDGEVQQRIATDLIHAPVDKTDYRKRAQYIVNRLSELLNRFQGADALDAGGYLTFFQNLTKYLAEATQDLSSVEDSNTFTAWKQEHLPFFETTQTMGRLYEVIFRAEYLNWINQKHVVNHDVKYVVQNTGVSGATADITLHQIDTSGLETNLAGISLKFRNRNSIKFESDTATGDNIVNFFETNQPELWQRIDEDFSFLYTNIRALYIYHSYSGKGVHVKTSEKASKSSSLGQISELAGMIYDCIGLYLLRLQFIGNTVDLGGMSIFDPQSQSRYRAFITDSNAAPTVLLITANDIYRTDKLFAYLNNRQRYMSAVGNDKTGRKNFRNLFNADAGNLNFSALQRFYRHKQKVLTSKHHGIKLGADLYDVLFSNAIIQNDLSAMASMTISFSKVLRNSRVTASLTMTLPSSRTIYGY